MTSSSAVRDAIRGARRRTLPSARPRRLGLLDLALAAAILAVTATRTPLGSLAWYAGARARGHAGDLPTLTAFFESGAASPPLPDTIRPPEPGPVAPGALPEPWRSGAATLLAERVPDGLGAALVAAGEVPDAERALAAIDRAWARTGSAERAMEEAAVGAEVVARAVERARAAGERDPGAFDAHRRFLPPHAAREADRFVGGALALATVLDLAWPIHVEHRVTSPFGERLHPTLKIRKRHTGVDLGVPIGTPVRAAQAGRLAVVGESGASGKYVVVDHGHGVKTSYCHLSETPLARGDEVARGDEIARSGNTGRSTGPHLHYAVAIAGRWVDPEAFRPRP